MTTTKRRTVAFKDVVAEPLNWKAPISATQEPEAPTEAQQNSAEQDSNN